MSERAEAALAIHSVLFSQHALHELPTSALSREITFGTLRFAPRLAFYRDQLLQKSLPKKNRLVGNLLLAGLYECAYLSTPKHAVVNEWVNACVQVDMAWAKGLVNAILRNFLRKIEQLNKQADENTVAATAHPAQLLQRIQRYYPNDWQSITEANNQKPPLTLRVNKSKNSRQAYSKQLQQQEIEFMSGDISPDAITLLSACSVDVIPGFNDGFVSVQDQAAQLAASLLEVGPNMRVLDACAAPGGKAAHILELTPNCHLTALDNDPQRLEQVQANFNRLKLTGNCITGSATEPEAWWDQKQYDRILIDAPCSGTGVIRRHPDIKYLRRESDYAKFANTQLTMLLKLAPLLKPGGVLLYATCSIMPEENDAVIKQFLQQNAEFKVHPITATTTPNSQYGWQILPGDSDGFYYCTLVK